MNAEREDGRARFLRAIAEIVPTERIAEVHLFPPMVQGGEETGVAVIAAYPVVAAAGVSVGDAEAPAASGLSSVTERGEESSIANPGGALPPDFQDTDLLSGAHHQSTASATISPADRHVVYRACYRWTRKGPDRGRWEIEVTEEADAPLGAVGSVVRGVYRRAGSGSEPERLSADAFRTAVSDEPWKHGR
ncbi:MAG: hypothetical protein H7Z74_11135 [Anaerolineae bacterium]|nr:hypothetical protein [Gemmatimonadaceae bacterium]